MQRFLVRLVVNAVALWITTLIVTGIHVVPFEPGETLQLVLTFLLVAFIFGIVNSVIGNTIRVLAFPIYILTLGLIALVVNGLLLMLVGWISSLIGFGLVVDSFWWGVWGAIVLGFFSWVLGLVARPLSGRESNKR